MTLITYEFTSIFGGLRNFSQDFPPKLLFDNIHLFIETIFESALMSIKCFMQCWIGVLVSLSAQIAGSLLCTAG